MKTVYGFGIVNKDGEPWWSEECVCQDRAAMEEVRDRLNEDDWEDDVPYSVVELFFEVQR